MKHVSLSRLGLTIATLSLTSVLQAAAFQFYELGAPVIGTAGVGQAALASDASTAYFNPAAMTQLQRSEVLVGTQIILPYTNFTPNFSNTIPGNNGGTASVLVPGLGDYFVYSFSPCLKGGLSLTSPYGGALAYNNHWVGRYNVQQSLFYTINLNPSLAYKVNQWMSLGAGVAVEYANLTQSTAIRLNSDIDGVGNVKLDSTAWGFNLGAFFSLANQTNIGIAYRSQIVHHLSGNTNFLNIPQTPNTTSKMVTPANIIASVTKCVSNRFKILGEVGWAHWSSMKDTVVTIDGYTGVTPENWRDTYRLGIGGQYQMGMASILQAGVSYDSSPTSSSKRLPVLPMDRQIRVGAGFLYGFNPAATLGISYEYINMGNASINNTTTLGTLSGSYSRNFANVLQISVNVIC